MTDNRRNPFYILLMIASFAFVITVLATALVPALEEKAAQAGNPAPPSEFRDTLRKEGWQWLLYEVGFMIVFGIACMWLDRHRRLVKEREDKEKPGETEVAVSTNKDAS